MSLTFDAPNAAAANTAVVQAAIAAGGFTVPQGKELWLSPFVVDSRKPAVLDFSGVKVRCNLQPGQAFISGKGADRHRLVGLWFVGDGDGFAVRPQSKWSVEEVHAEQVEAAVNVVEDKVVFRRVSAKSCLALFKVGPTDTHAGGQRVYDCRADVCGAFVEIDPTARMESWLIEGSTASGCDWMIRRQGAVAGAPPFMADVVMIQSGGEFMKVGTFSDPAGKITNCVFIGQGATLERNVKPGPPTVKDYTGNTLLGSTWLP